MFSLSLSFFPPTCSLLSKILLILECGSVCDALTHSMMVIYTFWFSKHIHNTAPNGNNCADEKTNGSFKTFRLAVYFQAYFFWKKTGKKINNHFLKMRSAKHLLYSRHVSQFSEEIAMVLTTISERLIFRPQWMFCSFDGVLLSAAF